MWSIEYDRNKIAIYLLNKGADIFMESKYGHNALKSAYRNGNSRMIALLKTKGFVVRLGFSEQNEGSKPTF